MKQILKKLIEVILMIILCTIMGAIILGTFYLITGVITL